MLIYGSYSKCVILDPYNQASMVSVMLKRTLKKTKAVYLTWQCRLAMFN